MDIIWESRRATVQDVVDAVERDLAYTTVMTTMKILDRKGVIRRCGKVGRAFLYEPQVTRDDVQRAMAGELTEKLFGGSVSSVVLSLIDGRSISNAEIKELKAAIKSLESGK
jgi:predicted transcriptional regulator